MSDITSSSYRPDPSEEQNEQLLPEAEAQPESEAQPKPKPKDDNKKKWPVKKPSMKRRAKFHNYKLKGTYMITLVTLNRRRLFGELKFDPVPYIRYLPLGENILNNEIQKITSVYPNVLVWQVCLMPDHIHIIVHLTEDMPAKKNLGTVVTGFKTGCNRAFWHIYGKTHDGLFEEGYNDRILLEGPQLQHWKDYLCDNPRRLAMKVRNPELFTTLYDINVCGYDCQISGNRFLLDIPDKVAVVVHSYYSDSQFEALKKQWLDCGERGGVIVSAAIAQREKDVMREAMDRGYNLILLRENGFPQYYKPSGEAFDACVRGQLLQISPWQYHTQSITIKRHQCLYLNKIAEALAAEAAEMQKRR